ncbi:MAG TPA: helix-turn-helix domain-containing protein, partial [Kribbella sp.]
SQPHRFNELRRLTDGISQRVLSATLRNLERDGLVERTVRHTVPPQVDYSLTARGRSLHTVLYQLVDWSSEHFDGIELSRKSYDTFARSANCMAERRDGPRPPTAGEPEYRGIDQP